MSGAHKVNVIHVTLGVATETSRTIESTRHAVRVLLTPNNVAKREYFGTEVLAVSTVPVNVQMYTVLVATVNTAILSWGGWVHMQK